jgi:ABC-type spermidine/putrescine transport system permease subunit II
LDEVVVTTLTAGAQDTLTLKTFGVIRLGRQPPEVSAVVVGVLNLAILSIAFAATISSGESTGHSPFRSLVALVGPS